jgi:hypothetical protein
MPPGITNRNCRRREVPESDHSFPDRYSPIPPNGRRCEFTGLGHSRLYQLLDGLAKDHVRVASLRESGAKRGTRIFHVGDMLRFLDGLAAQRAEPNCDDGISSGNPTVETEKKQIKY